MRFDIKITVSLKEGMLDPEARAIQGALKNLGFETTALSTSRLFHISLEALDREQAEALGLQMCERLLANPIIHQYSVEVLE